MKQNFDKAKIVEVNINHKILSVRSTPGNDGTDACAF